MLYNKVMKPNEYIKQQKRGAMSNHNTGALPADLKIKNRMLILEILKDGEAYSAIDIAKATGISRPTVMKSIQHFLEKGLVVSEGKGASTEIGGKKPELYSFVCNKVLLTITMWPELFKITLCGMNAKKIASYKVEAPIHPTPADAFWELEEQSAALLKEYGYSVEDLYGVSLSTAGIIDYDTGTLKFSSMSPEWGSNVEIEKYLRTIFGNEVRLIVENAGKMTGRAELSMEDIENKRILVLFSTWGFSACMIEKGHVLNGRNSLIGEVGHMIIDPHDDERCGCGSFGCAERLISKERIRKLVKSWGSEYPDSSLTQTDPGKITQDVVFQYSSEGDLLAKKITACLAKTFSTVIRNISLSFDPNVVVFQGDYAKADSYFVEVLKTELSRFMYYPEKNPFEIKFDRRDLEELDYIGAVQFLQRSFFKDDLLYQ